MSKGQKVLTTVLWAVLVLAMVGVISAGLFRPGDHSAGATGDSPVINVRIERPVIDFPAPEFALVNQDGQPVSTQSLKGSVWLAEFVFTHCAGPCREMSEKFKTMQTQIADPNVKFVSISVDPDRDTPAVLKQYGQDFGAKSARWSFLTGDKAMVYATAKGLLVTIDPATENTALEHDQRFVLVDSNGHVRGYADQRDPAAMEKLIADASTYAAEARKAAPAK